MSPLLSIITVSFNAVDTIADTMTSVAAQDFDDYEHLVVDGASRDETLRVVREHATKRTRIISEPDRGLYEAMQKGLTRALGDYVVFLNADDVYESTTVLSTVARELRDHSADIVYGDVYYVARKNTRLVTRNWVAGRYSPLAVQLGWHPPHPAFFARTNLLRGLGGFAQDLALGADLELIVRALLEPGVRVRYLPMRMVRMRDGGISSRSVLTRLRTNRECYLAMKRCERMRFPALATLLRPLRKLPQFAVRVQRSNL